MTPSPSRELCRWCGGYPLPGTTCPWSLPCPNCNARPGTRCRRPSGHPAASMHAARYLTAERLDLERGVTYPGQGIPEGDHPSPSPRG